MPTPAQRDLLPASEAVRATTLATARNGLRYGAFGELETTGETLQHIVEAVPPSIATHLANHVFLFVPLAIGETTNARDTEISRLYTPDLADRAICHRTVPLAGATYTFISTRLMQDRFALAFELFINVGHQFVDALLDTKPPTPLPDSFLTLLWAQTLSEVRGETSQDSYEARKRAHELHTGLHTGGHTGPHTGGTARSPHSSSSSAPDMNPDINPDTTSADSPGTRVPGASSLPSDLAARIENAAHEQSPRGTKPPSARLAREQERRHHDLEEQKSRFFEAALADSLAIYMLSLAIDLEYADLREREYPLLAAPALADRLRLIAELYPPPPHYEFAVRYRRRH